MRNKRRIFLSIHYRGALSLGENRQRPGYTAYHWGILISPKVYKEQDCYTFDVSDAAVPDPETRLDHNPSYEWRFRSNPTVSGSLLGLIILQKFRMRLKYQRYGHAFNPSQSLKKRHTGAELCFVGHGCYSYSAGKWIC